MTWSTCTMRLHIYLSAITTAIFIARTRNQQINVSTPLKSEQNLTGDAVRLLSSNSTYPSLDIGRRLPDPWVHTIPGSVRFQAMNWHEPWWPISFVNKFYISELRSEFDSVSSFLPCSLWAASINWLSTPPSSFPDHDILIASSLLAVTWWRLPLRRRVLWWYLRSYVSGY